MSEFVSRAGQKLEHALATFAIDVNGWVCADLGSNVGGFVDCLLQRGAKKVYAIDTGYGALEWKLRKDPRVVVMERTNAMHVKLPERVKLVSIDVAWTKQKNILPAARKMIEDGGMAISLIKPQYEADVSLLRKGVLPGEHLEVVLEAVTRDITACGFRLMQMIESPIRGGEGNVEMLANLRPA
jgi:23S rRNA (cytidine1920-2'-O)/16S rRNA (cytidine1409-2'-O)-methyltransferase